MANLKIYQIKNVRKCRYTFMSYSYALKNDFNIKDYEEVYSGDVDEKTSLEDVFRLFNRVTKEDCVRLESLNFKGHSLSTSDIVELDNVMYYCDSFGWEQLQM